jgi:hypothetical protein
MLLSSIIFFIFTFTENVVSITLIASGPKVTYCVYKNFDGFETIHLSYVIAGGYSNDVCHVFLYDPKGELIIQEYNSNSGNFHKDRSDFPNAGRYKLCFTKLSNAKMYISFELYAPSENGVIPELAKDGNFFA